MLENRAQIKAQIRTQTISYFHYRILGDIQGQETLTFLEPVFQIFPSLINLLTYYFSTLAGV